ARLPPRRRRRLGHGVVSGRGLLARPAAASHRRRDPRPLPPLRGADALPVARPVGLAPAAILLALFLAAVTRRGLRKVEGTLDAKGLKTALVVARFNDVVTSRLVDGALDALVRHGATREGQTVVMVPGSWELPQAAARLASQKEVDAVIALG